MFPPDLQCIVLRGVAQRFAMLQSRTPSGCFRSWQDVRPSVCRISSNRPEAQNQGRSRVQDASSLLCVSSRMTAKMADAWYRGGGWHHVGVCSQQLFPSGPSLSSLAAPNAFKSSDLGTQAFFNNASLAAQRLVQGQGAKPGDGHLQTASPCGRMCS